MSPGKRYALIELNKHNNSDVDGRELIDLLHENTSLFNEVAWLKDDPRDQGTWGFRGGPIGNECMASGPSGVLTLTCPCCLGNEDGHYTGVGNDPNGRDRRCDLCGGVGEIDVQPQ